MNLFYWATAFRIFVNISFLLLFLARKQASISQNEDKKSVVSNEQFIKQEYISSSGSEDEWEAMEEMDIPENTETSAQADLEFIINEPKKEESEESKWAKFLRLEVNRKIKERQINCHKVRFYISLFFNLFFLYLKWNLILFAFRCIFYVISRIFVFGFNH